MEWLGLLLLFGFTAFLASRHYTRRIDRIEAENAEALSTDEKDPGGACH